MLNIDCNRDRNNIEMFLNKNKIKYKYPQNLG